jgi:hypothetical protein
MATASPSTRDSPAVHERLRDVASLTDHPLTTPLRAAAFWAAILLPAVYLTLLAVGPEMLGGQAALFALLGLHAVSIVAGHGYGRA